MQDYHNSKIIGFDLGHGETALTWVSVNNQDIPQSLLIYNRKSQITAIANHPTRGKLIGDMAFQIADANTFDIAFKSRRFDDQVYQKTIQEFVTAIYEHLVGTNQIQLKDTNYFFIGCPSGWWQEEISIYQQLLSEILPSVTVVKESRAALMHAKESGIFTIQELQKSVLIIDIGSSTTDYTLVKGMAETPIDFGYDLGASLIEKEILQLTLELHRQYRQGDETIIYLAEHLNESEILQLEEIEQLEAIFKQHPIYRNRCELRCRKAKEEYFNFYELHETSLVNVGSEDIQRKFKFMPLVNGKIMNVILNKPLEKLDNLSWHQAFSEQLITVRKKLSDLNIQPSAILLTGSASKMHFVLDICQETFPELPCKRDGEPELSIARGLARWGRVYLRTSGFVEEISQFVDNELTTIVGNYIPTFLDKLAEELAAGLVNEVITTSIKDWRQRKISTLKALETDIEQKAKTWLSGSEGNKKVTNCLLEWLSTVQAEVREQTDAITQKYSLPLGTLSAREINLSDQTEKVSTSVSFDDLTGLSVFMGHLVGLIVGAVLAGLFHILLFAGILAPILGIVAYFAGESLVKETDIPAWVRNFVSDARIENLAITKKPELQQKIHETLTKDVTIAMKLAKAISEWLKESVQEQADKARLLIA
jgi:molecular chaperone DnaK (HSP70)